LTEKRYLHIRKILYDIGFVDYSEKENDIADILMIYISKIENLYPQQINPMETSKCEACKINHVDIYY
jgi:hypothetical protein